MARVIITGCNRGIGAGIARVLHFITGNPGKLAEVRQILLPHVVEGVDLDLEEIQELDVREIIRAKLQAAQQLHRGPLVCEDTSLELGCLNGFPGPLIKWLLGSIGVEGVYRLVSLHDDNRATARTVVGFADGKQSHFFEGVLQGTIVQPVGDHGFGWDPIFRPVGTERTLAQMHPTEKNRISMRHQAFARLKAYLDGID